MTLSIWLPLFRVGAGFAAALFCGYGFSAVTLVVGTNVNITRSAANNAEESIALNPTDPRNLFASESWSLAARYSTDGGTTWADSDTSAFPALAIDVSASWDSFGNLFLARLGGSSVVVGVSTNGGASFGLL